MVNETRPQLTFNSGLVDLDAADYLYFNLRRPSYVSSDRTQIGGDLRTAGRNNMSNLVNLAPRNDASKDTDR
jgi:hypothetical protein